MQKQSVVLLPAIGLTHTAIAADGNITIGSHKSLALRIHGKPNQIVKGPMCGQQQCKYMSSTVALSISSRVCGWDDPASLLKKELPPSNGRTPQISNSSARI
jgi:hypothetical protein